MRSATASVYFVQATPDGLIKIGLAEDVERRTVNLQTSCPSPLKILATLPSAGTEGEKRIHKQFAAMRKSGEWFWAGPDLLDFIKNMAVPWSGRQPCLPVVASERPRVEAVDFAPSAGITVKVAAELIGVSEVMIRRYITNGALAAKRVADIWLIPRIEAEQFKRPIIGRPRK